MSYNNQGVFFTENKKMNQFDLEKLLPFLYYLILAMWGGVVRYVVDLQKDSTMEFSFYKLTANLVISGFAGIITLNLVEHFHISPHLGAAMIAISGHAGVRMVEKFENLFIKFIEGKIK